MQETNQNTDFIKEFAKDPAIFDICENIGKKFGLLIDQVGDLDMEVRKILLGKSKSEDLTSTLSKSLEINKVSAQQIVEEVNKQIFSTLKLKMQNQSAAYHTSLGNSQMNANTYPQSFKPINDSPVVQKPTEPEVEPEAVAISPHADLEKAGGFTIEAVGNPLPYTQKPKPKPVELPKIQENVPEKIPTEVKTEPVANTFRPHEYYNFKNNSKEDIYSSSENVEDNKKETEIKEAENGDDVAEEGEKDVKVPSTEPEVLEPEESKTDDSSVPNIIPNRIVFKHSPETETKSVEPVPVIENPVTEKVENKVELKENNLPQVETLIETTKESTETETLPEITKAVTETEVIKEAEPSHTQTANEPQPPLADYLTSEMNSKSTVPDNLPTEETQIPNEVVKEEPPITINTEIVKPEEKVTTPVQTIQTPAKPVTENKPRAFDPYREIPQ